MLGNNSKIEFAQSILCTLLICVGGLLAQSDLDTIYNRRVASIISANHNPQRADQWRNELTAEGIWTDVDYTAGCPARRANWPAQDHMHRIITMASAWSQDQSDVELLSTISLALDWWNDRDYTEDDCVNAGGNSGHNCPCGTPGMWNSNWYDQMILIPGLFGNACLILKSKLTTTQFRNCTTQMTRAYVRIDGDPNGSMGAMTGANMLDVSSTGVSLGLLTNNPDLVSEAVNRYYEEAQIKTGSADGIKIDGSFFQHNSQLYNGNYGAVFMRTMLKIFLETKDTSLTPPETVRSAYQTVINGSEWLIYRKMSAQDPKLSWQYSAIGRMVSHKYEDWSGIGLDLDEILAATDTWDNAGAFREIVDRLRTGDGVNPGGLVGTRFFHISDFMVHRGANYIVTLKMFSTRTTNSECNNNQNPFGFHLSDGAIYTHLKGHEYTNVYGAWDWNLIPGSTADYGATPLNCGNVEHKGKESYVGGVALDNAGLAVMKYTNPKTLSLRWHKVFFFFPNSYMVQFVGDAVSANASVPVYTTLDQRQLAGLIYIDGQLLSNSLTRNLTRRLWHDRVGYEFLHPVNVTVDIRERQSNWSAIGISEGNEKQSHFTAFFENPQNEYTDDWFTYTAHLDIDHTDFERLGKKNQGILKSMPVQNNPTLANVKGAFYRDGSNNGEIFVGLAFITPGEYFTGLPEIALVESDFPILLLFQRKANLQGWRLAAADPGQTLTSVKITVLISDQSQPIKLNVDLPTGPIAGSTVVVEF